MEFTIHNEVLLMVFALAVILGAVSSRTNFCTMGAVSDWVNMGDTGRMRSWLLAIAVAVGGVGVLEGVGVLDLGTATFPPYRTPNFAWLRYVLGGALFGIGMTLASGCGNKTVLRAGTGNLKSVVVLAIVAVCAYAMMWTDFYAKAFHPWVASTSIDLASLGIASQSLGDILARALGLESAHGVQAAAAAIVCLGLLAFIFSSREFRASADNIAGGLVVGAAVVAGWYLTGGPTGQAWKEYAQMAADMPSRVETQSFTFVSPAGDGLRYLMHPTNLSFINFGIAALAGVLLGSFLYAAATRRLRWEWFANGTDFANHAVGAVLMGIGGILAMGCTIGQGVTGISTLALGSILAFLSMVGGAAAAMKFQYWRIMHEA